MVVVDSDDVRFHFDNRNFENRAAVGDFLVILLVEQKALAYDVVVVVSGLYLWDVRPRLLKKYIQYNFMTTKLWVHARSNLLLHEVTSY